jgi:hypothetical protein
MLKLVCDDMPAIVRDRSSAANFGAEPTSQQTCSLICSLWVGTHQSVDILMLVDRVDTNIRVSVAT